MLKDVEPAPTNWTKRYAAASRRRRKFPRSEAVQVEILLLIAEADEAVTTHDRENAP